MAKDLSIYKCNVCGDIIRLPYQDAFMITCCDTLMKLVESETDDAATEDYGPLIEKIKKDFYRAVFVK